MDVGNGSNEVANVWENDRRMVLIEGASVMQWATT